MFGMTIYNNGKGFYVDQCTRCSCENSTIWCVRETCPVLECPKELQIEGRCCSYCPTVEESRTSCTYGGRTYEASIARANTRIEREEKGENPTMRGRKNFTYAFGISMEKLGTISGVLDQRGYRNLASVTKSISYFLKI